MLKVATKLKRSKGRGIGTFLDEDVKKGTIVHIEELAIEKYYSNEWFSSYSKQLQDFLLEYGSLIGGVWYVSIDNARFINHSITPNLDYNRNQGITIANKDIVKGEEIFYNYFDICDYTAEHGLLFKSK